VSCWGAEGRIALLATLLGAAPGLAAEPPDTSFRAGWEPLGQSDGVRVYRKEVPGSPMVAFMGEGLVDAPLRKVANVIFDLDRATQWVDSLVDNRVVRVLSPTEWIGYAHVRTPFVLKDRDFVSRNAVEYDPRTRTLSERIVSVEDPAAPRTSHVRGRLMDSSFKLIAVDNGARTYVICEIHADPMGSVPKWVVNFFQKDWPHNSIARLRKQVARDDIREVPLVTKILGKP
jgi:hypothetical protein